MVFSSLGRRHLTMGAKSCFIVLNVNLTTTIGYNRTMININKPKIGTIGCNPYNFQMSLFLDGWIVNLSNIG